MLDVLDRVGGSLQRKLTRDYLTQRERLTKFHENRLWAAVYAYCIELADGYRAALVNFRFMAHALWTTAEAVRLMQQAAALPIPTPAVN